MLSAHGIERLLNFQIHFYYIKVLFYNGNKNNMVFTLSRRKHVRKVFFRSKKRICTTINSRVNSNKSNNLNESNSDNGIGNSSLPCINVQNESHFNKLITLQTN